MTENRSALRVLVVDDEPMIAELLVEALTDGSYEVVGPCLTYADALRAAEEERFDVALLDLNLGGRRSHPIADVLTRRKRPFAFLTGYGENARAPGYEAAPILAKPFKFDDLQSALTRLVAASPAG